MHGRHVLLEPPLRNGPVAEVTRDVEGWVHLVLRLDVVVKGGLDVRPKVARGAAELFVLLMLDADMYLEGALVVAAVVALLAEKVLQLQVHSVNVLAKSEMRIMKDVSENFVTIKLRKNIFKKTILTQ
jgi:hypothetical protein